uniref:BspA family leucine-rich repeat surface protein n=1 Tax=Succinivibrio sp. TaxID=2053619 RepID=UPI0038671707
SVIDDTIEKYGPCCDLNFIRLRGITDLSYLFCEGDRGRAGFCGDISGWDVSGVKNMEGMFLGSLFNGDISKWNVSKVEDMSYMFAYSKFKKDISAWNVSSVTNMSNMFSYSKFNGDISRWNVSSVRNMIQMFEKSKFNQNISEWNVANVEYMTGMFYGSNFSGDISKWNTRSLRHMDGMFDESAFKGDISNWDLSNLIQDENFIFVEISDCFCGKNSIDIRWTGIIGVWGFGQYQLYRRKGEWCADTETLDYDENDPDAEDRDRDSHAFSLAICDALIRQKYDRQVKAILGLAQNSDLHEFMRKVKIEG